MSDIGYFTGAIASLDEVCAAMPKMIFYGARTCWWTHDASHLGRLDGGIPCDPCGGVLYQTDDITGFLKSAEENIAHYGKHELRAFLAAHHRNCVVSVEDPRSTCFESWDDYNRILDEAEARS